jgi:DNA-directed RNA polymerase subunit RPC12/RpoP
MKILRRDKRVRCLKCRNEFWIDARLSNRYVWCPRCNGTMLENVKEYGKPVIEVRTYYMN